MIKVEFEYKNNRRSPLRKVEQKFTSGEAAIAYVAGFIGNLDVPIIIYNMKAYIESEL